MTHGLPRSLDQLYKRVDDLEAATVPAPTSTARGGVLQQTAIADLSAAPTEADFNGVLAALRSAGLLASS